MTVSILIQCGVVSLLSAAVYALVALGFNLITGIMKIVNFAHGHLVVLGMYLTIFLWGRVGIDPYLLLIITLPAAFCIGVFLHKIFVERILNSPELCQFTLTLGIMILLENLMLIIFGGNIQGLNTWYTSKSIMLGKAISINYAKLFSLFVSIGTIGGLYCLLHKTRFGKAMRAAADDKDGAALLGIDISRIFTVSFGLSVALAAVAGTSAITFTVVTPFAGLGLTLKSFIIVVLGGVGSIWGMILGSLLLAGVETVGSLFLSPGISQGLALLILIIMIVAKPRGLLGAE
ncbi:MAG: branched-chain amino acid ABC transporter permease [Deltaproteobacteria bacterium]|nr:branched-chain amino acid ABC transporter permease [Deltaproteobacteria bacterium]MBW2025344.1 branched-chain amino acid ABC transporter permease [Deltaproteobacteria bacterium]MBW2125211.1 branched-chain amino acid ABC transporter permease [Deltaproteobacteria bacterium]